MKIKSVIFLLLFSTLHLFGAKLTDLTEITDPGTGTVLWVVDPTLPADPKDRKITIPNLRTEMSLSTVAAAETLWGVNVILATEIDSIAEVETLTGVNIIVSTEIDTIGEIETLAAGVNIIVSTEIDTIGEIETLAAGVNILLETEIDASSELKALMDDETGTGGALVFAAGPALSDVTVTGSLNVPNGAAPTTDAFGEIAGDNNAWATGRGTLQIYDGTANTWAVNVLASDAPSNGQVPTWNTGGTITWETPGGASQTPWTQDIDADGNSLTNLGSMSGTGSGAMILANGADGIQATNNATAGVLTLGMNVSALSNLTVAGTVEITGVLTQTGNIELNHASANTISASSGNLLIEGNVVVRQGHTLGGEVTATFESDGSTAVTIADSVTVSGWTLQGTTTLGTIAGAIDGGGATSFEVPNGADPTTDAFGEVAADNDAWAASRGALEHFDGTASTFVVATLASDAPSNGQVPKWNTGGTITWEDDTQSAGSATTFNNIGDSDNNGSVTLGHTNIWDFTLDGSRALQILASDVDNAADTTLLTLAFNDAADANSIFLDLISDADGTPASVFKISATTLTTSLAISPTGAIDAGGATSFEIPNGNDPDLTVEGQISYDANGDVLRAYDGANQVAIGRKFETYQATVIAPNDLADAQRDAFFFFSNNSGMSFIITEWFAWSTSDDTDLNIETTANDGSGNATVDAVTIATNGTGVFTGTDSTITAGTIANGSVVWLDFDDTDTPALVHITIKGYYNADVN